MRKFQQSPTGSYDHATFEANSGALVTLNVGQGDPCDILVSTDEDVIIHVTNPDRHVEGIIIFQPSFGICVRKGTYMLMHIPAGHVVEAIGAGTAVGKVHVIEVVSS